MDKKIRFILVRPRNSLNIGAVARAAANFGIKDLAAVKPYEKRWREAVSAVKAAELLKKARKLSLKAALKDRDLVLGTASSGRRLERPFVLIQDARAWIDSLAPKRRKIAILFGSEKTGLSNAELAACHAVLEIPTDPIVPSMNLGQAAAVIAYELSRTGKNKGLERPEHKALDSARLDRLVEVFAQAVEKRMPRRMTRNTLTRRLRGRLCRWGLNQGDEAFLNGLLR